MFVCQPRQITIEQVCTATIIIRQAFEAAECIVSLPALGPGGERHGQRDGQGVLGGDDLGDVATPSHHYVSVHILDFNRWQHIPSSVLSNAP